MAAFRYGRTVFGSVWDLSMVAIRLFWVALEHILCQLGLGNRFKPFGWNMDEIVFSST